ncbi:hypothetical protein BCV70DRAFT_123126 [Testicularia cyperi]|uniref:Uncharacterized protein n=1 Tax=Testicularia cyperi TaxID=1882483 RepID=A0A317XL67_9BASI|nr:hypothetical protein BCV70DRAFT_123126 [Testicularia cyperi]
MSSFPKYSGRRSYELQRSTATVAWLHVSEGATCTFSNTAPHRQLSALTARLHAARRVHPLHSYCRTGRFAREARCTSIRSGRIRRNTVRRGLRRLSRQEPNKVWRGLVHRLNTARNLGGRPYVFEDIGCGGCHTCMVVEQT